MAVIGFKERITDLAGSLGTADDNALQQWIIDGCYDVISKVKGSGQVEASEFAKQSSAYTSSMTVALDDVRDVISVERDGISCQKIPFSKAKYADPNTTLGAMSIHKATSLSPVFYKHDNQLIVKPNPTVTEQGYYSYIPEYSLTDWTSTDSAIDNFPNQYYEHVILYAAVATLDRQLLDLLTNSDINTALTAINTQVDLALAELSEVAINIDSSVDTAIAAITTALGRVNTAVLLANAEFDLVNPEVDKAELAADDEDSEVATMRLSVAQGFAAAGSNYIKEAQTALSEANGYAGEVSARTSHASAQLQLMQGYISSAQAYASEVQTRMERDKQQYQWQQERRDNLKREYLSKFPQTGNKGGQ